MHCQAKSSPNSVPETFKLSARVCKMSGSGQQSLVWMRLSTDVVEAVNNPPRTQKVDIAKEESHLPLGKILPSGHEPYFTLFPHKKDNQPILNGLASLSRHPLISISFDISRCLER